MRRIQTPTPIEWNPGDPPPPPGTTLEVGGPADKVSARMDSDGGWSWAINNGPFRPCSQTTVESWTCWRVIRWGETMVRQNGRTTVSNYPGSGCH